MDSNYDLDESDGRVDLNHDTSYDNYYADEPLQQKNPSGGIPKPSKDNPNSISFQQRRWNRLRKDYNDQYLELFRESADPDDDKSPDENLEATQLGAGLWHPEEKVKLYNALCRKGAHDLQALASLVGSKSIVEIKAYLDSVREQETDRQRFKSNPRNASHADIAAAIEIGPECEEVLDQAADALLAFQGQYDYVAGQRAEGPWLITQDVAAQLDDRTDVAEAEAEDEMVDQEIAAEDVPISERAFELFRLSDLLELSERLFMNKGSDHPDSWHNIAEDGERPSLALDSATSLYDLVVNFLRRLVQSCLFIAQSRIRASTTRNYRARGNVKKEDVLAALDVLGVKRSARSYWVRMARRNGLKIVDDAHRRGVDTSIALAYDKVEESLSQSGRSRSISTGPKSKLEVEASSEDDLKSSGDSDSEDDASDTSGDNNGQEPENQVSLHEELDQDAMHDSQTEGDTSDSEQQSNPRTLRHKKVQIPEDEQDEYLERLDQGARQREELRLFSVLATDDTDETKEEDMEGHGARPSALRKSVEDCMSLVVTYEAEWESRTKRRRLDSAEQ